MSDARRDVLLEVLPHGRGLQLPKHQTDGSSGMDLRAAVTEPLKLDPGGRALVPTGIRVAIPRGWEWQIRPRSGLALRQGVTVLNAPGTVDSDYRGEVKVILINLGDRPVEIGRGERVAQAVLSPVAAGNLRIVDDLPDSQRGTGGFGHTGSN